MYYLAHYYAEKTNNGILITNDCGYYQFLLEENFEKYINHQLEDDSEIYYSLKSSGFLYEDKEEYLYESEYKYSKMKNCLFSGTRLFIIVLSNICNQRCVYCQAGDAKTEKMAIETCRKAIDIASQIPVPHVCLFRVLKTAPPRELYSVAAFF